MTDPASRVARIVQGIYVGLAVAALCFGGLSWVSSAADLGLFGFLQPSMEDVLDGRTADLERRAAIRTVDAWMAKAGSPGTRVVGTQTFTSCEWGQNNPEVDDGYRLRCKAAGFLVATWEGGFEDFSRTVTPSLKATCPDAGPWQTPEKPDGAGTGPIIYECSNGLSVILMFGASKGAADEGLVNGTVPCSDSFRCISGKTTAELLQAVAGSDFYVTQQVQKTYYEDQLW